MTCAIASCETLFDLPPVSKGRDRHYERDRSSSRNLFDVPTELVRRRGGESAVRPEEDLERWDGQS
jgi:hypothetical protein